jgi:WD40 repeat protein
LGDGSQILAVSKINAEEGKRNSYLFENVDYGAKPGSSVSTALTKVHDKGGYEICLSGRIANDWIVYGRDGSLSGASLGPEGPHEQWVMSKRGGSNFVIHPTRMELFSGSSLLDLKTGEEIARIDKQGWKIIDQRDLNRPQSLNAVWIGADRVLEPVEPDTQSADKTGAKQAAMLALWNVRTGRLDASADAPYVAVVAASPDGASILEGGTDKRVRVRNGATLAVESESRVHDQSVSGVAWHPTKPLVASASSDGTLRIWNRKDWSLVEELRTGEANPWDVQISPTGKRLLAMKFGAEARVYEPKSFQD